MHGRGDVGARSSDFLAGGGETAARIRTHDWSATPLGPIESWPSCLRTALGLVFGSPFPMVLAWGPELTTLHNDAYRPLLGDKPDALGRPFREVWSEAHEIIAPLLDHALSGEAGRFDDAPFTLLRHGQPEEAFFDFSYSPVRDETGAVMGVLNLAVETTARVLAERRQAFRLRSRNACAISPTRPRSSLPHPKRWAGTWASGRSPTPRSSPAARPC